MDSIPSPKGRVEPIERPPTLTTKGATESGSSSLDQSWLNFQCGMLLNWPTLWCPNWGLKTRLTTSLSTSLRSDKFPSTSVEAMTGSSPYRVVVTNFYCLIFFFTSFLYCTFCIVPCFGLIYVITDFSYLLYFVPFRRVVNRLPSGLIFMPFGLYLTRFCLFKSCLSIVFFYFPLENASFGWWCLHNLLNFYGLRLNIDLLS